MGCFFFFEVFHQPQLFCFDACGEQKICAGTFDMPTGIAANTEAALAHLLVVSFHEPFPPAQNIDGSFFLLLVLHLLVDGPGRAMGRHGPCAQRLCRTVSATVCAADGGRPTFRR